MRRNEDRVLKVGRVSGVFGCGGDELREELAVVGKVSKYTIEAAVRRST